VAEHADRWNVPMADPETYEHKLDVLAGHCESVGRDYDEIEKTVLARALVRDTTDGAHEVYEQHVPRTGPDTRGEYRGLVGTPADAASVVERFRDLGAEMVMIAVPRKDAETIERLAEDVLPEFA
jgi:alkanesulfonate monooxygenase SsuD/methylene tetrahydromethanopterin reductase-like flavin-dependent oxidoreductase (luciferase family)